MFAIPAAQTRTSSARLAPASRRRTERERGAVSFEFIGTFGLYMVLLLVAMQAMLAMFALAQANSAARNAARAEVISAGSGEQAGLDALAAPLKKSGAQANCTVTVPGATGEVRCDVTVQVPVFNLSWLDQWIPPLEVSRFAIQPMTEVR